MNEFDDIIQSLTLELRRGTIVLSVLIKLEKPQYGYTLVKELEDGGIPVDTNTLYPLLRRLEKQEILKSIWETDGNKPRKYYQRTEFGTSIYENLLQQWNEMNKCIQNLVDR